MQIILDWQQHSNVIEQNLQTFKYNILEASIQSLDRCYNKNFTF